MSLQSLLERGYFPKELPRPFVTNSFAATLTGITAPPADFSKKPGKGNGLKSAKAGRYSHARGGLLRRSLSICNPIHYFLLCNELIKEWPTIGPKVSGTRISATAPEFKLQGRAVDGKYAQNARSLLARETRLGRRYVLQTDIARFYHSIYTHSIPWAIHTKSIAKANHKFTLTGNRLDYLVRMGQDQQTIGVPIGPDSSLIIAELIMQRCDETLLAKLPKVKGHRFIDDYELSVFNANRSRGCIPYSGVMPF